MHTRCHDSEEALRIQYGYARSSLNIVTIDSKYSGKVNPFI